MKAIRSPLFYVGDKYKLMGQLGELFPKKIERFIEPFVGGGSVFLNTKAKEYLANDIDTNIINLHKTLSKFDIDELFSKLSEIISSYGLSFSLNGKIAPDELKKRYIKTYYAKYNKTAYEALTSAYDKKGGEFAFGLTITPKWALKYETEDKKFAIKFTTKADADITYGAGKNYTVSASGTKTYEANRDKSASFSVAPAFDLGLVFSPKPGTINLNAGVGLTTPSLKVDSITTQTRNTTDGTVTSSVNETKTTLKGEFKSDIAVGFTWFITKNVMFDASWNILDHFTFGVDNALGKKIAFLLSVKM